MPRTPAQAKSLEAKALAASSKSEGMRMLFDEGYTVLQVKELFEVPYGFAYGVAVRAGATGVTSPRTPKGEALAKAKPAANKAAAKSAIKPKSAAKPASPAAPAAKASKASPASPASPASKRTATRPAARRAAK